MMNDSDKPKTTGEAPAETTETPRYMNVTTTLYKVEAHLRYIGQDKHADMVNRLQILAGLMQLVTYGDILVKIAALHRKRNSDG